MSIKKEMVEMGGINILNYYLGLRVRVDHTWLLPPLRDQNNRANTFVELFCLPWLAWMTYLGDIPWTQRSRLCLSLFENTWKSVESQVKSSKPPKNYCIKNIYLLFGRGKKNGRFWSYFTFKNRNAQNYLVLFGVKYQMGILS